MTRLNVFVLLLRNVLLRNVQQSYSFYFCTFVNLLLLVSYEDSFYLVYQTQPMVKDDTTMIAMSVKIVLAC